MERQAKIVGLWALIIAIGCFISMIIAAHYQENSQPGPKPGVSSGQR